MDEITLKVRACGMLLGLACCDTLRTANEFLSREEAPSLNRIISEGPFNLETGDWTGDISVALCLADVFLAEKRYSSEAVMNTYAD